MIVVKVTYQHYFIFVALIIFARFATRIVPLVRWNSSSHELIVSGEDTCLKIAVLNNILRAISSLAIAFTRFWPHSRLKFIPLTLFASNIHLTIIDMYTPSSRVSSIKSSSIKKERENNIWESQKAIVQQPFAGAVKKCKYMVSYC